MAITFAGLKSVSPAILHIELYIIMGCLRKKFTSIYASPHMEDERIVRIFILKIIISILLLMLQWKMHNVYIFVNCDVKVSTDIVVRCWYNVNFEFAWNDKNTSEHYSN